MYIKRVEKDSCEYIEIINECFKDELFPFKDDFEGVIKISRFKFDGCETLLYNEAREMDNYVVRLVMEKDLKYFLVFYKSRNPQEKGSNIPEKKKIGLLQIIREELFLKASENDIYRIKDGEEIEMDLFCRTICFNEESLFPVLSMSEEEAFYRSFVMDCSEDFLIVLFLLFSIFTIDVLEIGEVKTAVFSCNQKLRKVFRFGCYRNDVINDIRTITIDKRLINEYVDEEKDISYSVLVTIVLLHEIGHSATDIPYFNHWSLSRRTRELQANYISSLLTLGRFDYLVRKINDESREDDYINPYLYTNYGRKIRNLLFIK